jgi:hypothetical protein
MSKRVELGEIDFEAIEYRNEYRHTKAVFTFLTAQAFLLPSVLKLLSEGDRWESLFGGAYLVFFAFIVAVFLIEYRSRVNITGQGLLLKRPWLKDVEITYSEIGEVTVNRIVIRESHASASSAISLSEARQIWDLERINGLTIRSRDGKKKIVVDQSLENFERFCNDLTERWRSAIDRYLGYAKGTSLRQPERYLTTLETLKAQREEALLEARPSNEIQNVGATKSE